jgi:hypothetical protein
LLIVLFRVERLESSYKNCPYVSNILVYADSMHNELLALIFPNKPALEEWAEKSGIVRLAADLSTNFFRTFPGLNCVPTREPARLFWTHSMSPGRKLI